MPGRVLLNDADWGAVRAALKGKLSVGLRPFENAAETWHFYRHSFAACGVTDWEMLETLALAGKTTFTVNWLTADFQPDRREGVPPKLETISSALELVRQSANAGGPNFSLCQGATFFLCQFL